MCIVQVRRFPAVALLRCCDGRELCFADGRYERAVPASLNETAPHARSVCGKYPIEIERAAQHALALAVPGARYAAREEEAEEAAQEEEAPGFAVAAVAAGAAVVGAAAGAAPRYRVDAAPAAAASLVIALPVAQRAAYRTALDRLKRRWCAARPRRYICSSEICMRTPPTRSSKAATLCDQAAALRAQAATPRA